MNPALPPVAESVAPGESHDGDASWALRESLLHDALQREPTARRSFLARACPDARVRDDVHALLRAHDQPGKLDELTNGVMKLLLATADRSRDAGVHAVSVGSAPALERYRIVAKLGDGGMGIVYRARDERLERDVALKFLPPHLSADEAAKKRFLVEARAAASLEHPNICTVHEIGETSDGQLYIVMGCYDGQTLDARISAGPLAVAEALRIAIDVAAGLARAHDRRIIHRDVKPANIMLTCDGMVKILDFGIAKLSDMSATQTVGVIGTLAYMSPEQAFGEVVDARTDIWALGVVLYEMLTGERPFRGPGRQAVLYSILTTEPAPVGALGGAQAPALERLLQRALAKKPDDRFATSHELLLELRAVHAAALADPPAPPSAAFRPAATRIDSNASRAGSMLTAAGERRHAAVVVTGIAGHADMIERLAPEEVDQVVSAIREVATDVATRHGGIVNHYQGDETVLLFGVATSHEDDTLRAVRAALELHARIRSLLAGAGIRLHSGVHTGALVAQRLRSGDRRFRLTGAPVDVATRLASLAGDDAVLLSPDSYRLVAGWVSAEPLAPLALRPDAAPVTPWRVTGESAPDSRLGLAGRARLSPLAGRDRELQSLDELLASTEQGEGAFAAIIGDPGAGKSRLLLELRQRVVGGRAQLIAGRCDAYGGTTPFIPFAQALRELLGIAAAPAVISAAQVAEAVRTVDPSLEASLPLLNALLGVESADHPLPRHLQGEHLQAAMLESLAALLVLQARHRPVVLLLEDWHWSDEGSRRALERLAEIAPAHRLLLVATCRPDSGIEWRTGDRGLVLRLRPLSLDGSTDIIGGVLGAARVAPGLAQQLHERTGGNPFFLEETCQALLEQGLVGVRAGEAVALEAAALLQLPETVQAVIRTRLDRLTPETRDMLRVASVIGREFTRAVMDELTDAAHDGTRQLDELQRAGLVQQTSVAPDAAYRFKHALTQEVAYDTLLEHQRITLHGRVATAIEARYAERLDEHREHLAHHYGRSGQWLDATLHGLRAADRSLGLSQFTDALAMLDRTRPWIERLVDDDRRRHLLVDLLFRQERVCETLGLRARQLLLVEELITLLAPHAGSGELAEAYLRQGDVFTLLRRFDAADRSLATALRLSRELEDRARERNALRSFGLLRSHQGRYEEAVDTLEHALALDTELGEAGAAAGDVASLGNVLRKMGRPHDAIRALEETRARLTPESDPTKWCTVLTVMASAYRDLGDDATALRYLQDVSETALARGLPIMASFSLPAIAHIQLQQGHVEEALTTYRRAADLSRRARHADGLAQSLRSLGEVLLGLGSQEEAIPHLREAAGIFAQLEDHESESVLNQHMATAHERCGRPADAHALWERVRARCETSGDPAGEAAALEGIARCARSSGVREPAIAMYERALDRAVSAGDRKREATLRNTLGLLRWEDGAYLEALRQYEAALRLCRDGGDRVHEGLILNSVGATLLKLRRYDEARTAVEEAARLNAATGEQRLEAHSHAILGDALVESGRLDDARHAFERSLALRPSIGDRRGEGWMHERIARALLGMQLPDQAQDARKALDAARAIADDIGDAALRAAVDGIHHVVLPHHRASAAASAVPGASTPPRSPKVT